LIRLDDQDLSQQAWRDTTDGQIQLSEKMKFAWPFNSKAVATTFRQKFCFRFSE